MSEHDFEPIRGLPGDLPQGEEILWQGAPRWTLLAKEAFHIRLLAGYFALMLVWRICTALLHGGALGPALGSAASVTPLAGAALAIVALLAWLNSRTTVYTITNRRVVMRFGAAIPKAINLPFTIIDTAALKAFDDGSGDLALTLKAPNKLGVLHIWPHARPWRLSSPQPTFRALADARTAAGVLARAARPAQSRSRVIGRSA
jgi:hypothetical protein